MAGREELAWEDGIGWQPSQTVNETADRCKAGGQGEEKGELGVHNTWGCHRHTPGGSAG